MPSPLHVVVKNRPRRSARALIIGTALCLTASSALAEGRSIVGHWTPIASKCIPMEGAIHVGPLGLTGDDMRCGFRSVVRTGNVVTWKGTCGFPVDDAPATVIATTRGETLTLAINGGLNGPYRRCKG